MYRCEVAKFLYSLLHFRRNKGAFTKFIATLHHTMTYGIYLREIFDGTDFLVEQRLKDKVNTLFMVRHIVHDNPFFAIRQCNFKESLV